MDEKPHVPQEANLRGAVWRRITATAHRLLLRLPELLGRAALLRRRWLLAPGGSRDERRVRVVLQMPGVGRHVDCDLGSHFTLA